MMELFIPRVKGYHVKCSGEYGNVVYVKRVKDSSGATFKHEYTLLRAELGIYQGKKGARKLSDNVRKSKRQAQNRNDMTRHLSNHAEYLAMYGLTHYLKEKGLKVPSAEGYRVFYSICFDHFVYSHLSKGRGKTINRSDQSITKTEIELYQGKKGEKRLKATLDKARLVRKHEVESAAPFVSRLA